MIKQHNMNSYKISLTLSIALLLLRVQAQSDSPFERIPHADTLQLLLLQNRVHSAKLKTVSLLETKQAYDFKNQYPYYTITGSTLVGDSIAFALTHLPREGYLYVYSLDPNNTPVLHYTLELGGKGKLSEVPQFLFRVEAPGIYGLCFLFLKKKLNKPEDMIAGMEMTHGSFLFRQDGLFGDLLLLPNKKWRMMNRHTGFEMDAEYIKKEEKETGILMYIAMEATEK